MANVISEAVRNYSEEQKRNGERRNKVYQKCLVDFKRNEREYIPEKQGKRIHTFYKTESGDVQCPIHFMYFYDNRVKNGIPRNSHEIYGITSRGITNGDLVRPISYQKYNEIVCFIQGMMKAVKTFSKLNGEKLINQKKINIEYATIDFNFSNVNELVHTRLVLSENDNELRQKTPYDVKFIETFDPTHDEFSGIYADSKSKFYDEYITNGDFHFAERESVRDYISRLVLRIRELSSSNSLKLKYLQLRVKYYSNEDKYKFMLYY